MVLKQSKGKKALKKVKVTANKRVDKLQNTVLTSLQKQVTRLKGSAARKYFDTNTQFNVNTSGNITPLTANIIVGTSDTTRIGDMVRGTSFHMRLDINLGAGATVSQFRVIVFRLIDDYNNLATIPQISDIINYNTMVSPHKLETALSYRIIHDRVYQLSAANMPQRLIRIGGLLHNSQMRWDSGPLLNGATNGHYFVATLSDQTGTPVNCILYNRFRYINN